MSAATKPVDRVGPYLVERELGRGAFGVVYRACHEGDPSTPGAIKVVEGRGSVDRLMTEPALVAGLDHPCVVRVLDYFVYEQTRLAIAMELVPGQDLKEALGAGERFDPEAVRDLLVQLGGALAEAHAHGVIHRDIKPANILVDRTAGRPRYVLTDFGVGPRDEGIRSEKRVAGTVLFRAPEQLRDRPGPQSDLWALGVVAYRMLTGAYPFPGPTVAELARQIQLTVPRPPSEATGGLIDPALERVVLRLLDRSETERIGSAGELLAELGHTSDSKAVLTTRPTGRPTSRVGARHGGASAQGVALSHKMMPRHDVGLSGRKLRSEGRGEEGRKRFARASYAGSILAMIPAAETLSGRHRRSSMSTVGDFKSRSSWEMYDRSTAARKESSS